MPDPMSVTRSLANQYMDSHSNQPSLPESAPKDELKEAFGQFVGETLFGSMLASMRKSVGKPAYMHGGRGEEVFQQQLDQQLVQEISKSSAEQVADPMYQLFMLSRPKG